MDRGDYTLDQKVFRCLLKIFGGVIPPDLDVCHPKQQKVPSLCVKTAPLGGLFGGSPEMPTLRSRPLLCQPALDNHRSLVTSPEEESPHNMSVHMPLLGFNVLVAPLNKIGASHSPSNIGSPLVGAIQELLGRVNATAKMAPPLHSVIRGFLQGQQVSDEATVAYLRGIKSLQRYDFAFKKFWAFCKVHNFDMSTATIPEVAAQLQLMATYFPSESKNVYSALLKIPGLDQLRFSPLLQACKKLWQKKCPKICHLLGP